MSDFTDQLEDYRAQEDHEAALQLLVDRPLMKYCGLWRTHLVRVLHHYPLDTTWNALWDCVEVDYRRLAELADEPEGRARFQLNRLRELRLIYPDGSKTAAARLTIRKFIDDAVK